MPWKSKVEQRIALIRAWQSGRHSKSDLAEAYGISRKTVSKWIERYREGGEEALEERSRAPIARPTKTSEKVTQLALDLRRQRPRWGADKIQKVLEEQWPDLEIPKPRTIHRILSAASLVKKKRRNPFPRQPKIHLTEGTRPNHVWSVDYKGPFVLGNGQICYPLTIADHKTRYLIACCAQTSESEELTRRNFEKTFEEFGLPDVIRSDRGRPFGSTGVLGLSRLNVWFLNLGIRPEHIEPARPDQNGRHERMHRTLKAETANPPKFDFPSQQASFDDFRKDFNEVRPHQALEQIPPARLYSPSHRGYPSKLQGPTYPAHYKTRRVLKDGEISWQNHRLRLGSAFRGETVGLREVADGLWVVCFGLLELGVIDDEAIALGRVLPRPTPPTKQGELRLPH